MKIKRALPIYSQGFRKDKWRKLAGKGTVNEVQTRVREFGLPKILKENGLGGFRRRLFLWNAIIHRSALAIGKIMLYFSGVTYGGLPCCVS